MNAIIVSQLEKALAAKVDAMALKPRVRVKAKGIPIGNFDAIADEMGRMKIKPKRKPPGRTLNQQYASANRKKYKGVAK
ncbi:hypothetical protein UFOVP1157_23 [uncultured Caudovirales phage]|uniref:Uncharacterized protein n=1 Tax=uncultured Caudovirales phage TaxID=2100421 RepID=A0A6J5NYK7_9CAUD|nr:hypothetical protein UFOVP497_12 [uncultured Caudovirales phage]CAB4164599.1 hypothetical protein UFOVP834_48 [uncultured Caudovirales phage]CAB4172366.1 hypothetical protein UFOVP922_23 [uncultured Caudovirales phage]CAB4177583.1 hypothetical protein UFOVP1006_16 [uncultured Caudovirales phage]CAB4183704.1 hypothetical protein UFOVP1096_4 [uncultured Caudovirales phage]